MNKLEELKELKHRLLNTETKYKQILSDFTHRVQGIEIAGEIDNLENDIETHSKSLSHAYDCLGDSFTFTNVKVNDVINKVSQ